MSLRRCTPALLLLALVFLLASPALAGRGRTGGTTGGTVGIGTQPVPATPEPGAFAVFALGAGLTGLAIRRARRARR